MNTKIFNKILSIIFYLFVIYLGFKFISWGIINATWMADNAKECNINNSSGACFAIITAKWRQFIYGFYPETEIWRVNLAAVLAGISIIILAVLNKFLIKFILLLLNFALILWLIIGGGSLNIIATHLWGGLFLTVFLSFASIILGFPLAILIALGRKSDYIIIKYLSIAFIELFRGVPLISVLFMASVILPLFLPEGVNFDKLLRAYIGLTIFQAAYLAEVIRGGLNALPKGQSDAAYALGLNYWQTMVFIILPQALKIMIPGIVNTFIALFKDTTLVLIIGLFDFLGIIQAAVTDPTWLGLTLEAYIFAAVIYWIFCFSMSLYSKRLEKRLSYDK